MKLKNKKTGEIAEFIVHKRVEDSEDGNQVYEPFDLNIKEWEDYEEPGEFYIVEQRGMVGSRFRTDAKYEEMFKEIGNYFSTREEAEKAVEKLKAWKRLKDKGVEFYGWRRNHTGTYELYLRWEDRIPRSYEVKKDLELLFGGEE